MTAVGLAVGVSGDMVLPLDDAGYLINGPRHFAFGGECFGCWKFVRRLVFLSPRKKRQYIYQFISVKILKLDHFL